MDTEQEKKLKALLRGEFLPLFVGLRSELKALGEQLAQIVAKEPAEVIKTEITNLPEPIKELVVLNLPEVQKTEITNLPAPQKEVEVVGLIEQITRISNAISTTFNDLKAAILQVTGSTHKVEVQNQQPYPTTIKVANLNEIKQPVIPPFPASIKVSNFDSNEAIPVVLATHDRRKLYDAFNQLYVANDVNLQKIVDAIEKIDISGITVDLSDIENLITETNEILGDILIAIQGGATGTTITIFNELSVSATTETTICSYTVPTGKTFDLQGVYAEGVEDGIFRLYKNATKIWQARNAWTNRNVQSNEVKVHLVAADVIYLKVYNTRNQAYVYSGGIYGNTV